MIELIIIGALVSVMGIAEFGARFIGSYRSKPFRGNANEKEEIARLSGISTEYDLDQLRAAACAPETFKVVQSILNEEDKKAGFLQRLYHEAIARWATSVGFTLSLLCLNVTVLKDNEGFQRFAAAATLVGTAYALWFILRARSVNRRWVRQRALSELLRAHLHLNLAFPGLAFKGEEDAGQKVDELRVSIRTDVVGTREAWASVTKNPIPFQDINYNLQKYWEELKQRCWDERLMDQTEADVAALYVTERPMYQLSYFAGAQDRISIFYMSRERSVIGLYLATVFLAVFETLLVFRSNLSSFFLGKRLEEFPVSVLEWSALGLLTCLILSALLTALYVSRNDRSLSHRYRSQERRIRQWFSARQAILKSITTDAMDRSAFAGSVLEFEDLMMDELLDWIQITSRDVVEIG